MSLSLKLSQGFVDKKYFTSDYKEETKIKFQNHLIEFNAGFFDIDQNKEWLSSCYQIFEKFKHKKNFVQIGIGGSALGPQMLVDALGAKYKNTRKFLFLDNIDPDYLHNQINGLNLKESLFYVVSKSGGTAETIAAFSIIINELKKLGVTKNEFSEYFVFCTDPKKSLLKDLAIDFKIECLPVPSDVGGRFSVLTPVGILPALFANLNIDEIFTGFTHTKNLLIDSDSALFDLTSFITSLSTRGINQTVLMPYSSCLRSFSSWFVQLWAESLGKKYNLNDETVHTGLTPIPSYGATDQHSQVQLFMEGPRDKLILFIKIENFDHDFELNTGFTQEIFTKLSNIKLSDLMQAELEGTIKALDQENRPYAVIEIPKLNCAELSGLILFFESLTAAVGSRLNIDPFNQPGVEAGKIFANEWLAQRKR